MIALGTANFSDVFQNVYNDLGAEDTAKIIDTQRRLDRLRPAIVNSELSFDVMNIGVALSYPFMLWVILTDNPVRETFDIELLDQPVDPEPPDSGMEQ